MNAASDQQCYDLMIAIALHTGKDTQETHMTELTSQSVHAVRIIAASTARRTRTRPPTALIDLQQTAEGNETGFPATVLPIMIHHNSPPILEPYICPSAPGFLLGGDKVNTKCIFAADLATASVHMHVHYKAPAIID